MNKLVNISEGTSLAFHGLALIAQSAPERLNVKTVAEKLMASEAHLAKVFQKLNKAGIISSIRGPSGGFVLDESAEQISLLRVYEILESPVRLGGCPMGREKCSFHDCIFESRMHKVSLEIYKILEEVKLSDFARNQ